MKRSKLSVSPKSKKSLRSRVRTKSKKRSESRKMSWKMSSSWKRYKPRERSKSKNQSKSRNRSKSKKGSVQREDDGESGSWVKYTSRISRVPVRTSYIDEIETLSPVRNSRLFHKNDFH